MTCSKVSGKKKTLAKYLRAPVRVVIGVGDLFVQSFTGNVAYGNSMGCPTPHTPSLPTRSGGRAANSPSSKYSAAGNRGKMVKTGADKGYAQPLSGRGKVAPAPASARRSYESVGTIDRIDEEEEEESDCDEQ